MAENNEWTQTKPANNHSPTLPKHYQKEHQEQRYDEETRDQPIERVKKYNNPPAIKTGALKKPDVRITGEDMKRSTVLFTTTIF